MLYIQGMSSCAVQEIVGISEYRSPVEMMKAFCKQTLSNRGDCRPNGGYSAYGYFAHKIEGNKGAYTDGLGENYVFHGVEKYKADSYGETGGYASKFAAWITEQKLGNVHGGDPVSNHRYHPDHLTRVFVWNPDREAVKAWWAANGGPSPEAAAKRAPVVLAEADEILAAPIMAPEAAVEEAAPKVKMVEKKPKKAVDEVDGIPF